MARSQETCLRNGENYDARPPSFVCYRSIESQCSTQNGNPVWKRMLWIMPGDIFSQFHNTNTPPGLPAHYRYHRAHPSELSKFQEPFQCHLFLGPKLARWSLREFDRSISCLLPFTDEGLLWNRRLSSHFHELQSFFREPPHCSIHGIQTLSLASRMSLLTRLISLSVGHVFTQARPGWHGGFSKDCNYIISDLVSIIIASLLVINTWCSFCNFYHTACK